MSKQYFSHHVDVHLTWGATGFVRFSGFDWKTMCLLNVIEEQSKDIANGVWVDHDDDNLGAGDQVWLGYRCYQDGTVVLNPKHIVPPPST